MRDTFPPMRPAPEPAADREVRFTERFFGRLGLILPADRGAGGAPSATDLLGFIDAVPLPTGSAGCDRTIEHGSLNLAADNHRSKACL